MEARLEVAGRSPEELRALVARARRLGVRRLILDGAGEPLEEAGLEVVRLWRSLDSPPREPFELELDEAAPIDRLAALLAGPAPCRRIIVRVADGARCAAWVPLAARAPLLFRAAVPVGESLAGAAGGAAAAAREGAARGLPVAHEGFPICLVDGAEAFEAAPVRRWIARAGEPDLSPLDQRDRVLAPRCAGCAHAGPCPGLDARYLAARGDSELRPAPGGARGNSFHWVLEELSADPDPARCPILDGGVAPWDRARHLFVRHQGKLGRFFSVTRDFSDRQLDAIKHARGQVYLDASGKEAPDDFPRDLVPLRRSALCPPCPEHARCTGLYEPRFEQLFERDDQAVRAVVAGLAGAVLDVGCGDGRYGDLLEPSVRAGTLRYVGIDPDPARIGALRTRWPWADLHAASIEELGVRAPGPFDHVLVLRSWNHLASPERALAALVARMAPHATLTVADNLAFGLARTPAQAARAERSSAPFEHLRDDGPAEVARAAAPLGLRELDRREVSPDTANQWLIRLARG